MLLYLRDLFVCFAACFFYGKIMAVTVRARIPASLTGAVSYLLYRIIYLETGHELTGYLAAALLVSVLSELLARRMKLPATVFVMPAIIPLVPGVGLYRSMLCLVQNDFDGFFSAGVRTLFISGIVAVAIAIVNAAARHFPHRHHEEKSGPPSLT